jgi:hypothetical protein
MSTAAATSPYGSACAWFPAGASAESQEIAREEAKEYGRDRRTPASFAWRDSLVEQVGDLLEACSAQGWDGYDAEPISLDSAHSAVELVKSFPEGLQTPAVVPEPDGDIAFEWRTNDNRIFSVSVTGPTLAYAGRFGGPSKQSGEEPFHGAIPRTILDILARHFPAS